jgi:hypothetical protein
LGKDVEVLVFQF